MTQEQKMLVRNCAFEIMKDKSCDGKLVGKKMPGVSDMDTAHFVANELYRLGIVEGRWEVFGTYYLRGQYNRDRLNMLISEGMLG